MNDLLTNPTLHSIIVGAIVSLGVWFVKREITRIDKQLANTVRRDELQQIRRDMDRRHEENLERLDRIDTATTGTHKRIDQLYDKLITGASRKSS